MHGELLIRHAQEGLKMRRKLNGACLNLEVKEGDSIWKYVITQIGPQETGTGRSVVRGGFSSVDEAWIAGELKLNEMLKEEIRKTPHSLAPWHQRGEELAKY